MKFYLTFNNTNDTIPFETTQNEEFFTWFLNKANTDQKNNFNIDNKWVNQLSNELITLDSNIKKINPLIKSLTGIDFEVKTDLSDYLDQQFLNKLHCDWVKSQEYIIDIDNLRKTGNTHGSQLRDMYPDSIRQIRLAEALTKFVFCDVYEDINMSIHRTEHLFGNFINFNYSNDRYQIFTNEKWSKTTFTNDKTHLCFAYTYLGRQTYNKWEYFDTNLENDDFYNYETLEWSFDIGLYRAETQSFSKEFLEWCSNKNLKPISRISIANIPDLQNHLHFYRKMLYNNGKAGNSASLSLTKGNNNAKAI